jgi:hypothetical protein
VPIVDYNSQIVEALGYRTKLQLRQDLMKRLGFAALAAVPPTGMAELLNSFLDSAHRALFLRPAVPRQNRIFTWTITAGQKFYGVDANEETGTGANKDFDVRKVLWVGIEDDGNWRRLHAGIRPEMYSQDQTGTPSHYEIRQSIELWPTPDVSGQFLRVLATAELSAFTADSDTPSINDEILFLMALYLAKRHYNQPDANDQLQIMEAMIRGEVAGTHTTRRYITGYEPETPIYPKTVEGFA